jgi:hypothetical protein
VFVCAVSAPNLVIDEANVPAEQSSSETNAWIPRADGDAGWKSRAQATARQATEAADGQHPAEAAGVTVA